MLLVATVAHAETDEQTFARVFKAPAVHDVVGYQLASGDYTRAVVGRYDYNKWVMTGVVLCNAKECVQKGFSAADRIEAAGVIDLNGAPAAFPTGQLSRYDTPKKQLAWPALVVRLTESRATSDGKKSGTERHAKLHVLSLRTGGEEVFQGSLEDSYPTGGGSTTGYRLERKSSKTALDIVAHEQRHLTDAHSHCLEPKPTESRYKLDEGHYRLIGEPELRRSGCG